jgi:hypothetical protein
LETIMSSKVSSGKNHNHSDAKPAGGYAGKSGSSQEQSSKQGGKNKASTGNQQSQAHEGGSENTSSDKGSKQ